MPDDPQLTDAEKAEQAQRERAAADAAAAASTKQFTQEDMDRVVRERLARQAKQFEGFDELKTKAQQFDELQAAQQTELEKAQTKNAELEAAAAAATARATDMLVRSAIVAEAARKNIVDPDAAVALIDRSAIEFDDTGAPKNIGALLDSLLEAKTYLAGTRPVGAADLGARGGGTAATQLTRDDLKTMKPEDIVKAEAEGRFANLLSGTSS